MRPEEAAAELGGLLPLLCSFDRDKRKQAVAELAARGEERAALLLRALLAHPDEVIGRAAGSGLRDLGSVDVAIAAAHSTDRRTRAAAVRGLIRSEDPLAIEALLRLARDPAMEVAIQALFALGYVGQAVWEEVLAIGAAGHRSIRDAAATALARSGVSVVPFLTEVLQAGNAARCRVALTAMDQFLRDGSLPEVVEPILPLLGASHPLELRREAAEVLGMTRDPLGVPALLDLLREPDAGLRAAAATALGKIPDPTALPLLRELLHAPETVVRKAALQSLGTLGDASAARQVAACLRDRMTVVRRMAAWALGQFGSGEGSTELYEALRDPTLQVREAAVMALWKREDPEALPALRARLQPGGEPDLPLQDRIREAIAYLEK